ncbi:MAG: glycoside hydrolase, partial [Acidobacteriota bacterium]|nr:glycoside hydrolase [Acidobacteriota bacterium]
STGAAHVMWLDHRGLAAAKASPHAHHEAAALDGVAMAQQSGLYYAREDRTVASTERELLKGVCYCCKVAMATGTHGEIFAAWRHVYPGNIRDIAFLASRDGGHTFEAPGRVSIDDWQLAGCPDDGPAMAVDGEGTVHVVWPTVIGGQTPEGAIFYASSRDGRTFSPRRRLPTLGSPKPMHPQIVADSAGRITAAWDEVVDGVRHAATRAITFDEAGQPLFGAARRLGPPDAPSSYPVLVSTSNGTLAVYVSGKPRESVIRVETP